VENVLGRFCIGVIFKANLSLGDGFEVGFVEEPIELPDMLAHVFIRAGFAKMFCDGPSDGALPRAFRP
jgi:hypothetical protein